MSKEMTRTLTGLLALTCALLSAGCHTRQTVVSPEGAAGRFPELELKERLRQVSSSRAVPLAPRWAVKQGERAGFVVPTGLAYSDTGDLYVSDNNAHMLQGRAKFVASPFGVAA